jgi:hypothetical protein
LARDNISSMGGAAVGSIDGDTKLTSQNLNKVLFSNFNISTYPFIDGALDLFFQVLTLIAFALVVMMVFRNFDSKSLLDNFKFEIKKAKEMH